MLTHTVPSNRNVVSIWRERHHMALRRMRHTDALESLVVLGMAAKNKNKKLNGIRYSAEQRIIIAVSLQSAQWEGSIILILLLLFKIKRCDSFCIDSRWFFTDSIHCWSVGGMAPLTPFHGVLAHVSLPNSESRDSQWELVEWTKGSPSHHRARSKRQCWFSENAALHFTASSRFVRLNESLLSNEMNCISFVVLHILRLIALHFKTQPDRMQSMKTHMDANYMEWVSECVTTFGTEISLGCDCIATNETINLETLSCEHTNTVTATKGAAMRHSWNQF